MGPLIIIYNKSILYFKYWHEFLAFAKLKQNVKQQILMILKYRDPFPSTRALLLIPLFSFNQLVKMRLKK